MRTSDGLDATEKSAPRANPSGVSPAFGVSPISSSVDAGGL
jgi:hypothetical protein